MFCRSLLNFVYFSIRHFDHYDHLRNAWLQKHFDMYYYTILPGFKYTIGIADSSPFWIYGPESQLYFLDSYVLKNGSGNWLAETIRSRRQYNRCPQVTTFHTDFTYYQSKFSSIPPRDFNTNRIHTFSDWGVVTCSSGSLQNNSTFVKFKSSSIRGEHVHHRSHLYPEFMNLINPGHEHPDQNSFTLTFLGDMFITDCFFGPKLTKANNVHMFYPSKVR